MNPQRRLIALITMVALAVAPALVAAESPTMNPISCASPASTVKVTSRVPASAASAKIYFKASGQQAEYYVDTRRAADGAMWAFIPAPAPSTPSFTYRVVSMDTQGVQVSSVLLTAATSTSCPAQKFTQDEQRLASNLVIGLTNYSQSAVPAGFLCRGIVSYITVSGEMRPNEECRRRIATGAEPGGATTATGTGAGATGTGSTAGATGAGIAGAEGAGLSKGTVIALTAGGLIAAGVVIRSRNKEPVSKSRP